MEVSLQEVTVAVMLSKLTAPELFPKLDPLMVTVSAGHPVVGTALLILQPTTTFFFPQPDIPRAKIEMAMKRIRDETGKANSIL